MFARRPSPLGLPGAGKGKRYGGFTALQVFLIVVGSITIYHILVVSRIFGGGLSKVSPHPDERDYNEPAVDVKKNAASVDAIKDWPTVRPSELPASNDTRRANAAFVVLVRNSELWDMLKSMRQVEDRFNKKFNYPWVFLNDEPFTDEFKRKTTHMTGGKTEYGLIPKEHWDYPEFIDQAKAAERLKQMDKDGVMYGGMLSYHKMCRFNSGFFYRQELVKKYDYYWRVEPGITYHCDINYDPFLLMMDNGYKYSYTIGLHEYGNTVPTLFDTTKDFMKKNPHLIPKHNGQTWLYDDPRKSLEEASYNMCHFWSNFEIGDVRFFNSERYTKFFDHLDRTGGFFYERWGDAPVHSIAAAILLAKEEVHWFNDFGYYHNPWHMCPQDEQRLTQCSCNPKDSLHLSDWGSCARTWGELPASPKEYLRSIGIPETAKALRTYPA